MDTKKTSKAFTFNLLLLSLVAAANSSSMADMETLNANVPSDQSAEKRAWQSLDGAWGKRDISDEDYSTYNHNKDLDCDFFAYPIYYPQGNGVVPPAGTDTSTDIEEHKRAWKNMKAAWGKRKATEWNKFRGTWGKREPSWNHLKAIWGKRGAEWNKLQSAWGKRSE